VSVIGWLLDGDPAIRWQVLRDLVNAPAGDVAAERARVEHDGWGARLLALTDSDGLWDGGACFPAAYFGGEPGQPWTATMHTLQTLQLLGLDPASQSARRAIGLVAENGRWEHAGQRYFDGEIEPCINGLLELERATGGSAQVRTARRSGEEYLIERGLFRRKSTGAVIQPAYLEFPFPYYWHYDVLRALDYFRGAGADPDPRMAEAVAVLRSKRQPDGRWLLDRIHPGRVHFDLEDGEGTPSRWNTLRALRVLTWWDRTA
jgi:hypothetical protein